MPIRNPPTRPDLFAEALREWMQRLGLKQREIAAEAHVTESTLSHWLRGDRPPDVESGLWLLLALHRRFREFQEDWTVAEALDGIAPLGWSWEDIWRTLTRRVVESSGEQSFRDWWRAGKPRPLPPPARYLPTHYVERIEQSRLLEMVTTWDRWRQARWDAVVVTGLSGTGKTTLLARLIRDPWVRRTFRDGILWLEGAEKEHKRWYLVEQACWSAGLEARGPFAPTAWARWAGRVERRLLLVIDDLVMNSIERVEDLAALVGPKGPQVVFAIASQKGARVREWLEEWLPSDRIAEWHLEGMREEEGLLLVEKVLRRKIQPEERATAIAVGDALGWHPFGLHVATSMARKEGWESLLQDLERARARENWDPVLWAIERQWNRVGPKVRWEITRLLWRTLRGGPMGAMLAGAIWKPWPVAWVASLTGRLRRQEAQRARWRLEELTQTGLVEEVTLHPAEWWRGTTMRTWRVAPMLRWFILQKTGRWRPRWEAWKRKVWWMVMFLTRDWYWRDILPPIPDSLILVGCLPNLLLSAVRIPKLLILEQKEKRLGRSGLVREWIQGKALGVPGTRLRQHWEYLRLWPLEETEMFNWQVGMMIVMLVVNTALSWMLWELRNWVISIGMWDVLDGWMKAGANLSLLLVLLWVVWLAVLFVYPLWACVLYGVPDRELERVVQMALRVSRVLQQLGPLREQEEWLRKAWEHWRGEGSAEWDNATQQGKS